MSRLRTLVAASILPLGSLVAQNPAPNAGPPVDPIATVIRNATTGRRRNIAQAFDSIPESKFSYKPTPAQLTIALFPRSGCPPLSYTRQQVLS